MKVKSIRANDDGSTLSSQNLSHDAQGRSARTGTADDGPSSIINEDVENKKVAPGIGVQVQDKVSMAQGTEPVEVTQMVGPMWSANGRPVVVPPGKDAPEAILSQILAHDAGVRLVHVTQGDRHFTLQINTDGSVSQFGVAKGRRHSPAPSVASWLLPTGTLHTPAISYVGVHHGAGTSTWATLLGGRDLELGLPEDGQVVAVTRATPAGLNASKLLVGQHGVERFHSFLVVADAPGKTLAIATRQIKVLSSAVPVVEVPWVSRLRGIENPTLAAESVSKTVHRVKERIEKAHIRVPRGFADHKKGMK